MPPRPLSPLKIALAAAVALAVALIVLNFTRARPAAPTAPSPSMGSGSAAPAAGSAAAPLVGRTAPTLPTIAAGSGSGAAPALTAPPSLPTLPAQPTGPYVSPVARYRDEARDDSWAAGAETQLRERLTTAIASVDCRATTCQLQLAPTSRDELQAVIARLESQAGLIGLAQEIVLGAVQPAPGELATMTVHARLR